MTDPTPPVPRWLDTADVRTWLTMSERGGAAIPDDQLQPVCAAVEPFVESARPEWRTDTDYQPDPETYHGAVMLAARYWRRRNSPGGTESFGPDGVIGYVARIDPDIERALRIGPAWARPAVG